MAQHRTLGSNLQAWGQREGFRYQEVRASTFTLCANSRVTFPLHFKLKFKERAQRNLLERGEDELRRRGSMWKEQTDYFFSSSDE